jgi:hypothetical protein
VVEVVVEIVALEVEMEDLVVDQLIQLVLVDLVIPLRQTHHKVMMVVMDHTLVVELEVVERLQQEQITIQEILQMEELEVLEHQTQF